MMNENDKRHAAGEPSPEHRSNKAPEMEERHVSFPLGRLVTTSGVLNTFARREWLVCLCRHIQGDWGDLSTEDWQSNDESLNEEDPGRLLSCYKFKNGRRLLIITEWDRSATTLLLPEEY